MLVVKRQEMEMPFSQMETMWGSTFLWEDYEFNFRHVSLGAIRYSSEDI